MYVLHNKHMHTPILQEYQSNPWDGNGTSKLNSGVFVACLEMWQIHGCAQRRLCGGLPGPARLPSSVPQTWKCTCATTNRFSSYLCLHLIKLWWFILITAGDIVLWDAITEPLPPVCSVTTQHLKHMRKGGRDVRYEFGKSPRVGCLYWLFFFWDRVNMYICLFCFVDFCLTLTYKYILYIYYLKHQVFG